MRRVSLHLPPDGAARHSVAVANRVSAYTKWLIMLISALRCRVWKGLGERGSHSTWKQNTFRGENARVSFDFSSRVQLHALCTYSRLGVHSYVHVHAQFSCIVVQLEPAYLQFAHLIGPATFLQAPQTILQTVQITLAKSIYSQCLSPALIYSTRSTD